MNVGALFLKDKVTFKAFAPLAQAVEIILLDSGKRHSMARDGRGYWSVDLEALMPGTRYMYNIDGKEMPDAASFHQPLDVFGPSQVIDHNQYRWHDQHWRGIVLSSMIIYELHVGTFTEEGTFEAAIGKLSYLKELGVNAIEVMPIAQFPGDRNWGYDGVFPFAVQNTYGGPDAFKKFVDACHSQGVAVVLDVVYNHLGPEGNVLPGFMPCFSDKYKTPWGQAINYDNAYSYGVRDFFIDNALYWFKHFHVDALRLDAIHGIYDFGARHVLAELSHEVKKFSKDSGRRLYLIAESDLNDVRTITDLGQGGWGMDAQWNDDFHHCVHTLLTQEDKGYYADFGKIEYLDKAYNQGFVYTWDFSTHRLRCHGSLCEGPVNPHQLVVCIQNHDQVGNRLKGERLSTLTSFEGLKLAATALLTSPSIPMLFMGEELGETNPFLYFMSFHDGNLIQAVRQGRKKEFEAFGWISEPPDPYSHQTFLQSKINWSRYKIGANALFDLYKHLIHLRKTHAALSVNSGAAKAEVIGPKALLVVRQSEGKKLSIMFNFHQGPQDIRWEGQKDGQVILNTADKKWNGPMDSPIEIQSYNTIRLPALSGVIFEDKI